MTTPATPPEYEPYLLTPEDFASSSVHLSADGAHVCILDQTLLPNEICWEELDTLRDMCRAITRLEVRGAPALGIFAGYCLYVLARTAAAARPTPDAAAILDNLEKDAAQLTATRPTAVNLSAAATRMLACARRTKSAPVETLLEALRTEALAIHGEDIQMCRRIAQLGLTLVKPGDGILTHCNAGALATSKYGTALGPILLGRELGIPFHVYADETRPLLQGARLTAFELAQAGVDATLICDNMAASVMGAGKVQAVFVGCDRVAANGDAANKIGTFGVAILARHFGIPFYVLGPTSTIDLTCATAADIPIEMRDPEEIRSLWYTRPMAPEGVCSYNPAFDVTPNSLITAIVTDQGIIRPPFTEGLRAAMEMSHQS